MGFVEEEIWGDRTDPENVFRWDRVRLNLPGSNGYDPGQPWVSKVRNSDGRIAAGLVTFVDDCQPSRPTKKETWQAARKTAGRYSQLFGVAGCTQETLR
jgi:hypothetical protein